MTVLARRGFGGGAAGGGSGGLTPQAKTASFTAVDGFFYVVDCTAGNVVVTPPATGRFGVKRVDGSANTLTVDPAGSVTTDGDLTTTLVARWTAAVFVFDGSNWLIESTARENSTANGTPISSVGYSAATDSTLGSTASATEAEVNTNLRLPAFTVPSSGVVIVRVSVTGNPNGNLLGLLLWDYAGGVAYSPTTTKLKAGAWTGYEARINAAWRISGLTPGASLSLSLGFYRASGAGTAFLYSGPTNGQAVLEAWAA